VVSGQDGLPVGGVSCVRIRASARGRRSLCDGYCKGRRYTCARCKRFVPYCFGGAGDTEKADDRWCDDCVAQVEDAT
jgi:hypothetical protein